jgi:DNA polymerase III subunit delta'
MNILGNADFLIRDDVNQSNINSLSRMVESDNISHAYLFYGNSMELLLKLALVFAAAINCPDNGCGKCLICRNTLRGVYPDVLIVEPEGSVMRIEEIKRLQRFMGLSSYNKGKKICIIKECELMNLEASNRLLKTLEDPPDDNSVFILLAEEISAIIPTVVSRCLVYGWDLRLDVDNNKGADFKIIDKYLNEGIKNMIIAGELQSKNYVVSLNLTLKIIEMLKKMEAAVRADLEKEFMEYDKSDFDRSDFARYIEVLKSKHKRRISKFHNLAMSRIFDIISAWLEDVLSVIYGAGEEGLNFKNNYNFIHSNIKSVRIEDIFRLMEIIDRNKSYSGYSVNSELALDNIFLKFQNIFI